MITGTALASAEEAERMFAEVRDDPAGRIRLAADAYAFGRAGRRYRPYRRAVVAFMRWQQARGVLNSLYDDNPGSPWWRAVNEDLLRDTVEAKFLIQLGVGEPSRPSVARWVDFFNAPSAQSWYRAHNASVVAGYLAHAELAAVEAPAERFFMNVVLVRVLYAHALVLDGDLALGRLSFLARLIGHPRSRGPQALLATKDVLPDRYPIHGLEIEELINAENKLGRMVDHGVIGVRVDALYAVSARALGEPRLLELVVDGAPAYAWPADQRHVWKPQSQGRFTSLIEFLTRPSVLHESGHRHRFAFHHLGRGALTGADGAVDEPVHDSRGFGSGPVDAAAGFAQGGTVLGEHTRWGVGDHPAAGVALDRPVLLEVVDG
jgi:hypothetical protein